MLRVLVVSSSGTCRAPLVATLLRHELKQRRDTEDDYLVVDAAGLRGSEGNVDARVLHLLEGRGNAKDEVVAAPHAPLDDLDVRNADLVLTMDREQRARATELAPRAARRIFCLREFAYLLRTRSSSITGDDGWSLTMLVDDVADGRGLRPPPRRESQDRVPVASPRWPLSARLPLLVVLPAVRGIADALAPLQRHGVERDVSPA